jgi:hypothetical protein
LIVDLLGMLAFLFGLNILVCECKLLLLQLLQPIISLDNKLAKPEVAGIQYRKKRAILISNE